MIQAASLSENISISDIYDLLYRLGVTANYTGFFHTSYAIYLSLENPHRLTLVTKRLYHDVAEHYGTTWSAVERNIRTVVSIAWDTNPGLLSEIAGFNLSEKPSASRFIAILAAYLSKYYTA